MNPVSVVAICGAALTIGAFARRPHRRRGTVLRFSVTMASWVALWWATGSSFAQRGMMNLPDHMISHVIVMFAVPMGLTAGATLREWAWLVPIGPRRRLLRWWHVRRRLRVPRVVANAIVAAIVMNVVMVAAHLPRVFDAVMLHNGWMAWGMEPAFFLSGLYFFHFLIPSWPRRVRTRLRIQFLMVIATMVEMLVVAMSMSIFTKASWYSVMTMSYMPNMPGMTGTGLSPAAAFQQQQLAAAILWICGDFWAVPCLVLVIRRLVQRDGSLFAVLERQGKKFAPSATS